MKIEVWIRRMGLLALASAGLGLPGLTHAAPADRDASFGSGGVVTTDFSGRVDVANAAALQPDGKIVVVGFTRLGSTTSTEDFAIARYNVDGSLDASFGTGGRVTTDFLGNDRAGGVVIQANGKIVVAGANSNQVNITRYNPDGSRDSAYGGGFGPCSGQCIVTAMAAQSDGRIVIVGRGAGSVAGTSDFSVIRIDGDTGRPDNFGFQRVDFFGGNDGAFGVVIQSDGKIVVGGSASRGDSTSPDFALARFNPDGSLDSSYGTGGKVVTDFNSSQDGIYSLALQSDGKVVAAGYTYIVSENDDNFALARYNLNGTLDTTFGTGGKVITNVAARATDEAHSIIIQSDGRIVAAGIANPGITGDPLDFALVRYNRNGTLDSGFGSGGATTTHVSDAADFVNALLLQNDGKLLAVGGSGTGDFALVRYLGEAIPTPAPLLNIATRMRVLPDPNQLIGGFIIDGNEPKTVVIRAIGPTLSQFFNGVLADPTLELFQGTTRLAVNDNWKDSDQAAIEATGVAPKNDLESAIVRTLSPGAYTAIVRGKNNGSGIGLVEVYDISKNANSRLANIASRGFVDTNDNVMIGGFIVGSGTDRKVVIRGIGPSLQPFGIDNALADPTLELRDSNGALLLANDNWRDSQQAEISATGLAPNDDREAAILATVRTGNYTAIVRGKGNTTGVGLVEVYTVDVQATIGTNY